ncbi:hypothetical protein GQ457_09G008980 [Hibiscus cannabinus]
MATCGERVQHSRRVKEAKASGILVWWECVTHTAVDGSPGSSFEPSNLMRSDDVDVVAAMTKDRIRV